MTEKFALAWDDFKKVMETRNIPPTEEEPIIQKQYEEYMAWCRKWIVPPEVISYEDFWRMAADDAKEGAK